jgi:hypothetical protein
MAGDKRSGGGDGVLTKLARDEVKGMRFQGDLLTPSLFANTEAALLPKGFLCQYAAKRG